MKKLVFKILACSIIFATVSSCSNFLDQEPLTNYTPEEVYSTPEGVEVAVNGLYTTLANYNYYGAAWHGLVNPHSGRMWSNQTVTSDATSLNCGTSNRWLLDMWPQMYRSIDAANNIIANVEKTNFANRDTSLGQAYFIRGMVYFDMVRLWGGVPLRLKPVTVADLYLPKSSKEEVYAQIISDLTKAKQLMPDLGQYKKDRPTKWAAYGYLAKVYMQLAGEDNGKPEYWQKAWDEAIQVYGKYSLHKSFAELFTLGTENTSEAIFELQFDHFGVTRASDVVRMYTPPNSEYVLASEPTKYNTFGWINANKETFDQFNTQYPNDPRLAATFIWNSFRRYNTSTGAWVNQNVYPKSSTGRYGFVIIRKWFDSTYNGNTTQRNLPLFRYADLLLMLAEIENEINGPANAYQYVNQVLARARNTVTPAAVQPADWSGMTKDQFRDRIMQERKFELLSEGQDWFDARRRGFQYFLNKTILPHNTHPKLSVGNLDYMYPTSEKNMLLPIPQTELTSNPYMDLQDQNPGY